MPTRRSATTSNRPAGGAGHPAPGPRHESALACLPPPAMPLAMDNPALPPVQPTYQDRRTGLIVFGVFAILIGACCALLVPLAFFGQMMAARQLGTDFDTSAAVISAAVYGLMAVVLIWLGVGSVLAKRWARALLLCLGWIGLIIGLVAMPAVFLAMNSIGASHERSSVLM